MGCGTSSLETIRSTESKCSTTSGVEETLVVTTQPNKTILINENSNNTESSILCSFPKTITECSAINEISQTSASSSFDTTSDITSKEPIVRISYKDIFEMNQQGGMLSFSSFLGLARVRQVLTSQVMNSDGILGLFQIYDKDNDKRLLEDEFIDLMDILDLSYGLVLDDGSQIDTNAPVPSHQSLKKPAKRLTYKGPDIKSLMQSTTPITLLTLKNPATDLSDNSYTSQKHNINTEDDSNSVQFSTKKTNLAPIGDKQAFSQQLQHLLAERRFHRPVEAPTTPSPEETSPHPHHHHRKEEEEQGNYTFQSPPSRPLSVKRGFMLKKDGIADSPNSRNSRFFTLNDGTLTYYESASLTPPFSIDRKSINLSGMNVTVVGDNTLQLQRDLDAETPSATNGAEPSHSHTSHNNSNNREVFSLQIKNISERDDWIAAIQEHIDFSASMNHTSNTKTNMHSNQPGRLFHQLSYDYINSNTRSEVGAAV